MRIRKRTMIRAMLGLERVSESDEILDIVSIFM